MALNHDLIGVPGESVERSWTSSEALLYAIGVGAGLGDPLQELQFTTENSQGIQQQVLPTFGVLLARAARPANIGDYDRAMGVHAEQSIELHRPLPVEGTIRTSASVTGIYDKGSGALVQTENVAVDAATGEPVATCQSGSFIRGEGGFGGDRGSSERWHLPDRAPDHKVTQLIRPEQTLLYRLSGDRNPLHTDPAVAARGGFAGRSCTACARTASPPDSSCMSCAVATRRVSISCPAASPARSFPASRWSCRCGWVSQARRSSRRPRKAARSSSTAAQ